MVIERLPIVLKHACDTDHFYSPFSGFVSCEVALGRGPEYQNK
jgi:hypothetical protein